MMDFQTISRLISEDVVEGGIYRTTYMVAMRDGVNLATDVYRSEKRASRPVLVERTPYSRRGIPSKEITINCSTPLSKEAIACWFAERGYNVVIQDVRGRYDSEGAFVKYLGEAEDGFDTYHWICQQHWCDGLIGSFGFSYSAHTQLAAACAGSPGLAAMFIDTGGLMNAYKHSVRRGGAFELKQLSWAVDQATRVAHSAYDTGVETHSHAGDLMTAMSPGVWQRGDSPLSFSPEYEAYLFDLWESNVPDPDWLGPSTCAERWLHNIPDIPIFLLGSWNDPYAQSMLELYQRLSVQQQSTVRLTMGPWLHGRRSQTFVGDVDFGVQSTLDAHFDSDYLNVRLAWFDQTMQTGKREDTGSCVTYFIMGGANPRPNADGRYFIGGEWITDTAWTSGQGKGREFYFCGQGQLRDAPMDDQSRTVVSFDFDPRTPFMSVGGAVISADDSLIKGGIYDHKSTKFQSSMFTRSDVLVFDTECLENDYVILGICQLTVMVTLCTPSCDIAAYLFDMADNEREDAPIFNITDGIRRIHPAEHGLALVKEAESQNVVVSIQFTPTAYRVRAGHRLRLIIAGSNFPRFDLNSGTGESWPKANQTIITRVSIDLGGSHLLLPGIEVQGQAAYPEITGK